VVAVSAINTKFPSMKFMVVANRLCGLIPDTSVLGRSVVSNSTNNSSANNAQCHNHFYRNGIGPSWKEISHLVQKEG